MNSTRSPEFEARTRLDRRASCASPHQTAIPRQESSFNHDLRHGKPPVSNQAACRVSVVSPPIARWGGPMGTQCPNHEHNPSGRPVNDRLRRSRDPQPRWRPYCFSGDARDIPQVPLLKNKSAGSRLNCKSIITQVLHAWKLSVPAFSTPSAYTGTVLTLRHKLLWFGCAYFQAPIWQIFLLTRYLSGNKGWCF